MTIIYLFDAPDEDWIALVGQRRWIAITKDKNIRYRAAELKAINKHNAKVLVVGDNREALVFNVFPKNLTD